MSLLALAARRRQRVLYIVPHQDDDHLTLGGAMVEDIAAGHDVYALIVTNGDDAGDRTLGTADLLGYTPTHEEYAAARDREFVWAVENLGATPIVRPYAERASTASPAAVAAFIKASVPWLDASTLLRTHSIHDYHTHHRNLGYAAMQLVAEGFGTDLRLCISGYKKHLASSEVLYTMGTHGDLTLADQWSYRTVDVPNGWWGIAWRQIASWFNYILNTDSRTYWHEPPSA